MKIVDFVGILIGVSSFPHPIVCSRPSDSAVYASSSSSSLTAFGHHDAYDTDSDGSNITNIIESNNVGLNVTELPGVTCEVARIKCALRQGCGTALKSYMLDCADLMQGRMMPGSCDEFCKASLIALTSTQEGEDLMNCLCTDDYCRQSKRRLEVCRKEVILANARNAVVSCSVAHLICSADTSCSTALYYYDKFCRRMFTGRSCSFRCNNSISILERQKKAEKLSTCLCDGTESFACESIKTNMATLCFNQKDEKDIQKLEEETNQIHDSRSKGNGTDNQTGRASNVGCERVPNVVLLGWIAVRILSWWTTGSSSGSRGPRSVSGLTSSEVVRWL